MRGRPPVLAGALALLVGLCAGAPVFTNDVFWHVATGAHLVETGGFPERDPFSYTTQGKPWILHEWLSQIVFWAVHAGGGWLAIRALTALLSAAIVLVVFRMFRRELGHALWGAAGALLFVLLGADRLQARPTLFTILATQALVDRLLRRGTEWRRRDAVWAALLVLLWINLHSIGLIALALLGAFLAGALVQRPRTCAPLAATLGLGGLATLATPEGLGLYAFALQDKRDVMQYVTDEWGRFHFAYAANESLRVEAYAAILAVLAFLAVAYVAVALALQRAPRGQRPWPDAARAGLLLALLAGGLLARRFHWMLCLAALLALTILRDLHRAGAFVRAARVLRARALRLAARGALVAMLALAYATALRIDGRALHRAVSDADYGRELARAFRLPGVELLRRAGVEGNVFCDYGSGGLLLWALHPRIKVCIDSRIDLYRRDVYLQWLAARDGRPDQTAILDRWGTDIYYRHWQLAPPRDREAWELVYAGTDGEIWLRRGRPGFARNLERCRAVGAAPGR
jgi:hypothetical protein